MRYSQLRAFHAVATHGGFSAAAAALGKTQPALSDQVRRLEQDHDVLLFRREHRQVALTNAGTDLLRLTRQFFDVEANIGTLLDRSRASVEGQLRVVADAAQHVTEAVARFRARHGQVTIKLQTGNSDQVLSQLRAYEAEIGVVGKLDPGAEFDQVDLGGTPIAVVVAAGGPFDRKRPISFAEIAELPVIMREQGSRTRENILAEAARRKVVITPAMEVQGREAMREVVATGAGIGFVSHAEFGHDSRLRLIALADAELIMPEVTICLSARRDVPAIRAFMRALRRAIGQQE